MTTIIITAIIVIITIVTMVAMAAALSILPSVMGACGGASSKAPGCFGLLWFYVSGVSSSMYCIGGSFAKERVSRFRERSPFGNGWMSFCTDLVVRRGWDSLASIFRRPLPFPPGPAANSFFVRSVAAPICSPTPRASCP